MSSKEGVDTKFNNYALLVLNHAQVYDEAYSAKF